MYKLYFLLLCLILLACGNETNMKSKNLKTQNVNNSGDSLAEDAKETVAKEFTATSLSLKEIEKIREEVVKAKEVAQEVKKDAINGSVFKDEPCEVLISKYKKAISLLRENKNSSEGREIYNSLRNDPIMKKCRSVKVNKSIFKELDRQFHGKE